MRAKMAGARSLDREQWAAAVNASAKQVHERYTGLSFEPAAPWPSEKLGRPEIVKAGDVVLDAQLVLDVELALVEAEQAMEEFAQLVDEEVDAARAARLRRKLDEATTRVRRALSQRGSS